MNIRLFWEKVNIRGAEECWEWHAGRNRYGYGNFKCKGKTISAHRLAWSLTHGEIPPGLCVCHKCDNPPCCNPAHLFLETSKGNTRDSVSKGRIGGVEHRARMSAMRTGVTRSLESRLKQSATLRGRRRKPFSAEHRANLGAARRGKPGHPQSAETRMKISIANRAYAARQKSPKGDQV